MIDFPIVDAHHHLQELSRGYPWLEGAVEPFKYHGDDRPIRRDYAVADYLADVAPLTLAGSVHVENGAADPEGETEWIQHLHESTGVPSAHVARVDLQSATAPAALERAASVPVVRGVRYILNWHENPRFAHVDRNDIMADPMWLANFARLAPLGLSFDLQVFPSQLRDAAALAAAHPDTTIVLDHAGMPIDRDAHGYDEWRAGMAAVAAQPNVFVKISALGTNDHTWTTESIRPFVWETIELFGTHRTMFGSNFPVDSLYSSFSHLYAAFDELTSALSRAERVQLFATTAARFYRLD
jgi:predicted TIM-barrel fold metal-dependent hydrolase